jgi:hypothetical protein
MSDPATISSAFAVKPEARREALDALAAGEGWKLTVDSPRTHLGLALRQWQVRPQAVVGWKEDHTIGARVVFLDVDAAIEKKVLAAVPCYTRAELVRGARYAPSDRAAEALEPLRCLRRLALVDGGNPQPDLFEVLAPWSRHPLTEVRRATLHLASYLAGPGMLALADERAQGDPDLGERWGTLADGIRKYFGVK